MTEQERLDFDRLDTFIAEGRLIRGSWRGRDDQNLETACLMAALYPACGEEKSAAACPASLMPSWLAGLSVWIDDNGTLAKWPGHIKRYAAVIRGVVALAPEKLDALSRRIRVIIVREAVSHVTVDDWGVRAACEQTITALEGGERAAARAAARAAHAAAAAARAAAYDAAYAYAAYAAGAAAAYAAADADAAHAAAAYDAARDRMIDGFLSAMEEAARTQTTGGGR